MASSSSDSEELQDVPATSQAECVDSAAPSDPPTKSVEDEGATSSVKCTTSTEGVDNLLQKQKSEIMVELQRLSFEDRPVSGQSNRRSVEDFFMQHTNPEPRTSEQNRPESVTVEVNALVDRRPVTSMLQSRVFRRNLEFALRGAVNTVNQHHAGDERPSWRNRAQPTSQRLPRQQSPVLDNGAELRRVSSTPETAPSQHTPRSESSEGTPTPAPRRTRTAEWLNEQREPAADAAAADDDVNDDDEPVGAGVFGEGVERARHEEFVMEVSELVHRHLVTSSLSGAFRSTLESLVEDRVENSGSDGRRVAQFINTLPRNQFIQRNDFSHLGINDNDLHSSASDISIISAAAAVTVPANQTNAAMSREIHALKTQLQQLQNMMKLSFDLQMDIQRSIRQEVAAAVSSVASARDTRPPPGPANAGCCLVCLDKSIDTVLYQCGHMCVCMTCGLQLVQRGSHCPVCRAPIRDVIRAYKSSSS